MPNLNSFFDTQIDCFQDKKLPERFIYSLFEKVYFNGVEQFVCFEYTPENATSHNTSKLQKQDPRCLFLTPAALEENYTSVGKKNLRRVLMIHKHETEILSQPTVASLTHLLGRQDVSDCLVKVSAQSERDSIDVYVDFFSRGETTRDFPFFNVPVCTISISGRSAQSLIDHLRKCTDANSVNAEVKTLLQSINENIDKVKKMLPVLLSNKDKRLTEEEWVESCLSVQFDQSNIRNVVQNIHKVLLPESHNTPIEKIDLLEDGQGSLAVSLSIKNVPKPIIRPTAQSSISAGSKTIAEIFSIMVQHNIMVFDAGNAPELALTDDDIDIMNHVLSGLLAAVVSVLKANISTGPIH